jgi:uncharacterized membrane protein YedE/YeeE
MNFPIEALAQDERSLSSLAGALAAGFAFGFVLERAGFGRAQKLVAQFDGSDMTVFKVMFTAIVTAMLGVATLSAAGLVNLAALSFEYPTWMLPMVAGGFLLGVGFIVSGYCPGTSVVAAASGKLDGLVTVAGTVLGALGYAEIQPAIVGFHEGGKLGPLFLYQVLHLSPLLLSALVLAMALVAFRGAEAVEHLVAARAARPTVAPKENP